MDDSGGYLPLQHRHSSEPRDDVSTLAKFSESIVPQPSIPSDLSTSTFIPCGDRVGRPHQSSLHRTTAVEREFARNTTLEVNHIGTPPLHLLDRRNIAHRSDSRMQGLAF